MMFITQDAAAVGMLKRLSQIRRLLLTLQLRNITFCVLLPLLGAYWSLYQQFLWQTAILSAIFYILSGIGITAGYHRLWSHRSFTATFTLRCFLAVCGASSVQGSIISWCRDHRAHHRYVDTPRDPYNVKKGFLWAHMGWLIFKPDPKLIGHSDVSDLINDGVVVWQHRNFPVLCILSSYVLPSIVAEAGWGDGLGGLLYAGIIRAFLFQQSTNCVNSLAHYLGDQPYADARSPRDHVFTALVTFGEGYHNFHHEFPCDYRNGIRWFDYDPTKWCIVLWKWSGLARCLQEFPANEIDKALFQQKQKQLKRLEDRIIWGVALDALPVYTWDEYQTLCSRGDSPRSLVCISGVIYDVEHFQDLHPGGSALLRQSVGKDATARFNGGVYDHTKAAHNLLEDMRFGLLQGGGKVECLQTPRAVAMD